MSGVWFGFTFVVGVLIALVVLWMARNIYYQNFSKGPLPVDIANRMVLSATRSTLKRLPTMSQADRDKAFRDAMMILTGSIPNLYPETLNEVTRALGEITRYSSKITKD
jgi:hypothetical protein